MNKDSLYLAEFKYIDILVQKPTDEHISKRPALAVQRVINQEFQVVSFFDPEVKHCDLSFLEDDKEYSFAFIRVKDKEKNELEWAVLNAKKSLEGKGLEISSLKSATKEEIETLDTIWSGWFEANEKFYAEPFEIKN